ncbi:MAG: MFS transporter [Deltaproteobacteria bacterium]|nr:MFS transporter [Deltaproteobacteria bacterium]
MVTITAASQRPNPFLKWYVLGASFLILFLNAGARFSIGVMFKPLISEFSWTRSDISFAFSLNMVMFALSLLVVGRFYDRYGPKWVIVISTILLSGGYISVSFIHSFWQFLFFYGILSGIGLGGTSVPLVAALTSKWFNKGRGLAISLALSGSCLGHFTMIPLFTIFVLRFGWRDSYFYIGLIMLVVNTALAFFVIKGDPEALGYTSHDRAKRQNEKLIQDEPIDASKSRDMGLREAMKTYSFWLFVFVMFVCGSGDFFVSTHLIPYLTDQGMSAAKAGNMLAWYGLVGLAGLLIAGPASDLIGNKIPIALTFLVRFILFLLVLKYQNLVMLYIFSLSFGLTFLVTAPIATTLTGKMYGLTHLGILTGFISTIHHLGGGLWAYVGGFIFDRTGSYHLMFILSAILALVAFLCSILIREKRHFPVKEIS